MKIYERIGRYVDKVYGMTFIKDGDDSYFICPECGEPLYRCDWDDEDFLLGDRVGCPICDFDYCSIYEV